MQMVWRKLAGFNSDKTKIINFKVSNISFNSTSTENILVLFHVCDVIYRYAIKIILPFVFISLIFILDQIQKYLLYEVMTYLLRCLLSSDAVYAKIKSNLQKVRIFLC